MVTKDGWEFGAFRLAEPTHDTPEAVLTAAIRHALATKVWPEQSRERWMDGTAEVIAISALAALDGWRFIYVGQEVSVTGGVVATADWTGSTKRADAEEARLRAALAEIAGGHPLESVDPCFCLSHDTARAALAPSEPRYTADELADLA